MSGYPQNCLVLLVEDDFIVAMTLEDELEAHGYTVAGSFSTCAGASKWLETETPDLAILDIRLSDGPCNQLAAELTKRGVPFMIFSGFGQSLNTDSDFADAVWVEKPAPFASVLEALEGLRAMPQRRHG